MAFYAMENLENLRGFYCEEENENSSPAVEKIVEIFNNSQQNFLVEVYLDQLDLYIQSNQTSFALPSIIFLTTQHDLYLKRHVIRKLDNPSSSELNTIAQEYIWLPISSCGVERSFSNYNNILAENRQNLSLDSLQMLNIMYFNQNCN